VINKSLPIADMLQAATAGPKSSTARLSIFFIFISHLPSGSIIIKRIQTVNLKIQYFNTLDHCYSWEKRFCCEKIAYLRPGFTIIFITTTENRGKLDYLDILDLLDKLEKSKIL